MGQINLLLGNLDEVRKQIENLKRDSAEHLLGLALAFRVAKRVGDDKSASDILARFAAAYDAELKRGKPEYEAHRFTIEKLHASTTGLKTVKSSNQLPKRQESGAQIFESKCAGCHGPSASGSNNGPPLVHRIYQPGHHANASFYQAIRRGVKSHHWSFGDMPPIPGVTDEQIDQIISYVRKLQVKNGIK
jgi:mono/diheme cytochrome c family protein